MYRDGFVLSSHKDKADIGVKPSFSGKVAVICVKQLLTGRSLFDAKGRSVVYATKGA